MDVPDYIAAVPVANQLDGVAVYYYADEVHGTSGSEGAGGYILGFKS